MGLRNYLVTKLVRLIAWQSPEQGKPLLLQLEEIARLEREREELAHVLKIMDEEGVNSTEARKRILERINSK